MKKMELIFVEVIIYIYIKLFSAYYLPEKSSEYSIGFSIADMNTNFKNQKAINRNINWFLTNSIQYQNISNHIENLPDLFIYLLNKKGTVISFQRIEAKNFYLKDNIVMIKLYPEPINQLCEQIYFSGIIKTRIKIFNRDYDSLNDCNTDLYKWGWCLGGTSNENEDYDLDYLENILNKKDSDDYLGIGKLKIPSTYKFYTIVVMYLC